jgi:orotate phosphoribosyltransferase
MPGEIVQGTEVVAGPVTGGALLAHTIAGLLDSRRSLTHPPCSFAPFNYDAAGGFALRPFYRRAGRPSRSPRRRRAEYRGDLARCAALVKEAGGTLVATVEIYDRCEANVDLGVPNVALAEYRAPENYPAAECPLCKAGTPITRF